MASKPSKAMLFSFGIIFLAGIASLMLKTPIIGLGIIVFGYILLAVLHKKGIVK